MQVFINVIHLDKLWVPGSEFLSEKRIREDTHFFLVVGQLRFYPPYTNGLVV